MYHAADFFLILNFMKCHQFFKLHLVCDVENTLFLKDKNYFFYFVHQQVYELKSQTCLAAGAQCSTGVSPNFQPMQFSFFCLTHTLRISSKYTCVYLCAHGHVCLKMRYGEVFGASRRVWLHHCSVVQYFSCHHSNSEMHLHKQLLHIDAKRSCFQWSEIFPCMLLFHYGN